MISPFLLAVSLLLTAMLVLLAGWFLWGRPLARGSAELADKREALGRSLAEVAAYKAQAEAAQPFMARAADLEAQLAAAAIQLEERERAYTLANQARDLSHKQLLDDRERHFQQASDERERHHQSQIDAMKAEFAKLATEALANVQARFSEQAGETLKLHRSEAEKNLAASKEALARLVEPMRETLGRYGEELKTLESKREQAYGSISEQLAQVTAGQQAVRHEATRLVSALRSSAKASGAWGEAQLRNVLEMAGLREDIDFTLQTSTTDEDGRRRRPDAILKLPGGRELIVDAKCSLADYLAAFETDTEQGRADLLKRHASSVRAHAKGLAERSYWKEFAHSADFVVLFVPGENFLSAALEHDFDLLGWAFDQHIILAGPINLLAIARVVAMVWRQEKMAEEARSIGELGAELYASLATMTEHIVKVGANLGQATDSYNRFIGSLERRVLSKARKFPDLGVDSGKKDVPTLTPVEQAVRLPQSADLHPLQPGRLLSDS